MLANGACVNSLLMKDLYFIVDPDFCKERDPIWVAAEGLAAGVRIIQLRCKSQSPEEVLRLARAIAALKAQYAFTFIVNDFLDIAIEVRADGLHLGQQDLSVEVARRALGPQAVIGLSTHDLDDVVMAGERPINYIGFGAVFPTATKSNPSHPVPGLAQLREAVRLSPYPVVAIGGITAANVTLVRETGAAAYAVLSAIGQAADVQAAVKAFFSQI